MSAAARPSAAGGVDGPDGPDGLDGPALGVALGRIAAGAAARDATRPPAFPASAFDELRACGALSANAVGGAARPPAAAELSLVRRVAAADGSVGRILDGHLNAVERLAVQAPQATAARELRRVRDDGSLLGVWGGDPAPGEGPPAQLRGGADGAEVVRGVKTFCSGAPGLSAAVVLVRPPDPGGGDGDRAGGGPPVLVLVEIAGAPDVEIDTGWFRGGGMNASVSHRVVFHDAPAIARLGGPGAIAAQPWFARDALRTAASWAGIADSAVDDALAALRERPGGGELEALAAGRMLAARHTIDVWLAAAAEAMDTGADGLAAVALNGRAAIADACRTILDEAARACGSRPFATGRALDRARRDLELFLLQHRLDPLLARAGAVALAGERPR